MDFLDDLLCEIVLLDNNSFRPTSSRYTRELVSHFLVLVESGRSGTIIELLAPYVWIKTSMVEIKYLTGQLCGGLPPEVCRKGETFSLTVEPRNSVCMI